MASSVDGSGAYEDYKQVSVILKALHEQRTVSRFCDVILRVCGDQIFAHSNVLAAASPYFGSFLGHGQDLPRAFSQKTPQIIEIHIDGNDGDGAGGYGDAVRKVVDFMYTSIIELNYNVLTQVTEIAKIMQMDAILKFCEQFQKGESEFLTGNRDLSLSEMSSQTSTAAHKTDVSDHRDTDDNGNDDFEPLTTSPGVDTADTEAPGIDGLGNVSEPIPPSIPTPLTTSKPKPRRGRPPKIRTAVTPIKSDHDYENLDTSIVKAELDSNPSEDSTSMIDNSDKLQTDAETSSAQCGTRASARMIAKRKRIGRRPAIGHRNKFRRIDAAADGTEAPSQHNVYKCDDCSYTSLNLYHYRRHRQIHCTKRYKCDKCDFTASRLKVLGDHKRQHLHEENVCSFCEYQATDDDDLKMHLLKHDGPTPYFCTGCDATFRTRTQLNLHAPKHYVNKPYVCQVCSAGFKWKHALKNHMVTHSATKDHLCDVCGFATAHKSQLKAHRLIHTGDTFKCQVPGCNFEATKRQNLKYHNLTHTHEKPHQCEICGQSFTLVKNMRRHMLLHTNDRPFKCEQCAFTTTRYDKLKEHALKQHGIGEMPTKKHRLSDYNEKPAALMAETADEKDVEDIAMHGDMITVQQGEGENVQTFQIQVQEASQETDSNTTTRVLHLRQGNTTIPLTIAQVQNVRYGEITYPTIQYVSQVD